MTAWTRKEVIGDAVLYLGGALQVLRTLPDASAQTCITSPPYWGLRDYGVEGQIGLERTPEEYVARLVEVFREVRRVLREDGTLWLNLGDSYSSNAATAQGREGFESERGSDTPTLNKGYQGRVAYRGNGIKPKDLVGIPWRVAFALQADGWWLRSDIIWHKPNPMPESVTDRPTKAHEYLFLLAKSERYYYDAEAIAEPAIHAGRVVEYDGSQKNCAAGDEVNNMRTRIDRTVSVGSSRNRRSVWTIATQPYSGAHFATFPPRLIEPCVMAGAPSGGVVLDPFMGSGTTGEVSLENGRAFVGIELSDAYFGGLAVPRIQAPAAQGRLFEERMPEQQVALI